MGPSQVGKVFVITIAHSGARYKVYEHTHASDRHTGHLWFTRVTRNSLPASCAVPALLVVHGRGWGCRAVYELPLTYTISNILHTLHHPLLNAIVRGRIPNKMQRGFRRPFLCNRVCYDLRHMYLCTHVYLCTPTVCSDAHRILMGA